MKISILQNNLIFVIFSDGSLECRRFLRARECFFAKGCYSFSPQSSSVINQRWRLQKYEHKQAAFARPKYVCTGCLWTKSYYVTIQMKPPQQNLHLVLYIFSMLTWVSSDSTDSLTDSLNAPSWSFSKETKFSYSNAPPWTKLRIFLS